MNKKILFRADGNSKTGLGHLYRMFALVEMYKEQYDFVFLTKEDSILNVIPSDYKVRTIPSAIEIDKEPYWINTNFSPQEYIIIADGYQFVSRYQKKIKELGFLLMYIDDLGKEYMYADLVVNHSPHAKVEQYKNEVYTKFALGTNYVILRPSFLMKPEENNKVRSLHTAFVCFGGADIRNFTYKSVMELLNVSGIQKINVVVGEAYSFSEIFEMERNFAKVSVFRNLDEVSLFNLMNTCTFAIAPTSTILFELISVNMYLVSGYYVENQEMAYHELVDRNVFEGIGDFNKYQFDFLQNHLSNLSPIEIEKQIEAQRALIDGNQESRFLTLLNNLN